MKLACEMESYAEAVRKGFHIGILSDGGTV